MNKYINKLICGDSSEILKDFPDECIDLVVTSPPYDDLRDYKGYSFDFETIAKELYCVVKDGGVVVWVVADKTKDYCESLSSFKQAIYFVDECGFNLFDTMIYMKDSFVFPANIRYHNVFEYMFVFSKGKPKTFNPIKDRIIKKRSKCRKKKCRSKNDKLEYQNCDTDRYPGERAKRFNVWQYSPGGSKSTKDKITYKYPAIMPEKLAKDHILSWSNEKDIVLDPFVGSGTVPKMCWLLNRKYIGIDVSEEYIELAKKD